jgi:hypothetical protein
MIDNTVFYHGTIRKTVVAFGSIFNNIHIERKDDAGDVVQLMKIPLSYGPKQKFLMRIRQNPDLATESRVQLSVPRIGFEIVSMYYDNARKVAPTAQMKYQNSDQSMNKQYNPQPYNIQFAVHVLVKHQDDGLQIIEQILPFFGPDYVVTLKDIPEMGLTHDVPFTINNISYDDVFEGDMSERTSIIWTLNFTGKINMYGPVSQQGVIKKAIATVYPNMPGYVVEGDNERYTATVDPETAGPNDNYTILEQWDKV